MTERTASLATCEATRTPFEVAVFQRETLIVSRFCGLLRERDLLDAQDYFERNIVWGRGYGEIIDVSAADLGHVSVHLMAELAARFGAYFDNAGITAAKVAIYGPSDVQFGMGRVFEAWASSLPALEVCTFRDRDAAREWIQQDR